MGYCQCVVAMRIYVSLQAITFAHVPSVEKALTAPLPLYTMCTPSIESLETCHVWHQFLSPVVIVTSVYQCWVFGVLVVWLPRPSPMIVLHALILRESARLLQGRCSSVVREPTAKVGGLGFNSQWLPMHFFSHYSDLPAIA